MASTFNPTFAGPPRQPAFNAPIAAAGPVIPGGTFAPGTKVQVGGHRVVIVRYLSEGGFAHVYLVRLPKPVNGDDSAVLKRVAVPDKEALSNMRNEVETMKRLRNQRHIVNYIDSHASQLKGGGYEVFLLMEYCNGGGLIDFMNTRLQNRLTEPEILKIFSDAALGVACMHYLKPPLLHRDLKVENILISSTGTSKRYKLCDFGSAAPPRPAATSAAEGRLIEDDVQKHTTMQYRSPEMIDVYRKQPIDEKSDIWALGVLLYKLCYYKTPFEDQGQMAILNATFKFPGYPTFSDSLKKLIAGMLREMPQARPTIYQVVREISLMRGADVPIKDIYAARTPSEARRNQRLPLPGPEVATPPAVGASKAPPVDEKLTIPDIVPMRRGRPTKAESDQRVPKSSPSPLRITNGDPFSALDSVQPLETNQAVDEIASKFPSLDEFSLLHESGDDFAFDKKSTAASLPSRDISQRVTNALADEAFARPVQPARSAVGSQPEELTSGHKSVKESQVKADNGAIPSSSSDHPLPARELPTRSKMVSIGTMTSPESTSSSNVQSTDMRPIFHFPSPKTRSSSHPRPSDASLEAAALLRPDSNSTKRPGLLDHRSKSQVGTLGEMRLSGSRKSSLEVHDPTATATDLNRSRSANSKIRPSSLQIEPKRRSLRSRAHSKEVLEGEGIQNLLAAGSLSTAVTDSSDDGQEAAKISSNVAFLKAMEEEEPSKRKEKRLSSGSKHIKRASMPSISLSGTKNLLAGRFGEAFRRFESNATDPGPPSPTLSPDQESHNLTPIAGSEATDGRSDDGQTYDETEPMPPEVRRELERQRLTQEEKRVAEAGAAYRQRLAKGGDVPINPRAASIQSKVRTLLDESGRGSPSPTKKPEGYGRFTDPSGPQSSQCVPSPSPLNNRQVPRKELPAFRIPPRAGSIPSHHSPDARPPTNPTSSRQSPVTSSNPSTRPSISSVTTSAPPTPRPLAPPKPQSLRVGNQSSAGPPPTEPSPLSTRLPPHHPAPYSQVPQSQPNQPPPQQQQPPRPQHQPQPQPQYASSPQKRSSNPYRPPNESTPHLPPPPSSSSLGGPPPAAAANDDYDDNEDWESSFSKRYPTLAGLEMVETEINGKSAASSTLAGPPPTQQQVGMRVRDV
ncbi:MAG: hypothetical protein Q9225_006513 [Loekoesia sp. 1 TL-2023]